VTSGTTSVPADKRLNSRLEKARCFFIEGNRLSTKVIGARHAVLAGAHDVESWPAVIGRKI
jgi:hypothetical protein